jgi:hypothetical protein
MIRINFIAAAITGAILATPGVALAPLPVCEGDAIGTSFEIVDYTPSTLGQGFVFYTSIELATDAWITVLEYCPEKRQLVLRTGHEGANHSVGTAAETLFNDMVFGAEGFTMDQMAARLRDMGADAELRGVSYESCACSLS